jgi:hypothetical protein
MKEPAKKLIEVLEAEYVHESDSIVLIGRCEDGMIRNQINSSCFSFGNKDKSYEMEKTAKLMIGKKIYMVFDEACEF